MLYRFPYIKHVVKGIQFKERAYSEIKGRYTPIRRRETRFQRRDNREIHNEEIIIKPAIMNESLKRNLQRKSETTVKSIVHNRLRNFPFKLTDFKTHSTTIKSNNKHFQFP